MLQVNHGLLMTVWDMKKGKYERLSLRDKWSNETVLTRCEIFSNYNFIQLEDLIFPSCNIPLNLVCLEAFIEVIHFAMSPAIAKHMRSCR